MLPLLLSLLPLAALALAKQKQLPCSPDPFSDPRHDPCNPLLYIASNTLTGITVGLYLAVGLCHIFNTWRRGAKWMSAMTVGVFTFTIGIASRFGLHTHPQSKGTYIVEYLFVVLSPCAFIAADYVLLGRLATHLGAAQNLLIRPQRITRLFITSDVTTFLIQAAGGAVSIASNDVKTNKLGSNIFLAGLVLQLVSFLTFTLVFLRFLQRVRSLNPEIWQRDSLLKKPWYNDWRALAFALFFSCIGILIRSVFRVIELSEGFKGPLATNEGAFYGLDTLPLFIAVAVYVLFWPGRFIPPNSHPLAEKEAPLPEPDSKHQDEKPGLNV